MPYFFVDESGDTGFVFGSGSSDYFVLVFLWLANPDQLREKLARLRANRRLAERFEFKYRRISKNSQLLRLFLEVISSLPVKLWILAVDKRQLPQSFRTLDRQAFYNFAMGKVVEFIPVNFISEAVLVIDNSAGAKKFTRSLRVHLSAVMHQRGQAKSFKKILCQDSDREDIIQAADVVAGLTADILVGNAIEYYEIIAHKVEVLIRYPAEEK